jgi:DNA adenine methylase
MAQTSKQLNLFGEIESDNSSRKVVNVSTVPKRSPFRYAGGKTWLIPTIRKWIGFNPDAHLIEPFCGGGIVSLSVAAENRVRMATMVEKDEDVAAAWLTIFNNHEWLIDRMLNFQLTKENVDAIVTNVPTSVYEHGFQTIIRNRTNHGGILAKGAGTIKNGEKGKGLSSRWYPKTLTNRITGIAAYKDKLEFIKGDAFDYMTEAYDNPDVYFFIDPPYTVAGKRLYTLSEVDHEEIFRRVSNFKCHYLVTYDKSEYILSLIKKYNLNYRSIPMQTTHLVTKEEVLISDNFDWLD